MPSAARILIPFDLSSARSGAFQPTWTIASFDGRSMGTAWTVKVAGPPSIDRPRLETEIHRILDLVVSQMSPWESDSDLRRFERLSPGGWLDFRPECFEVLLRALEIAEETRGIYDPTFAQAINLLGFGPSSIFGYNYGSPEVAQAFADAGYHRLTLDPANLRAMQPGSVGLDLCSIAKGYAVDRIAEAIEALGIDNYCLEIGGEARGLGCKPDGQPWLFAIERPPPSGTIGEPPTTVALCGLALATSGSYRRQRTVNGTSISHLVRPIGEADSSANTLLSVSVIAPRCIDADAYATALFLMGADDGLAFASRRSIAAIFLSSEGERLSPAAQMMAD